MATLGIVAVFVLIWAAIYVAATWTTVEAGHIAVKFRLGDIVDVYPPGGPYFPIPYFDRLEIYSTQTHQHEFPGEPEEIDRDNSTAAPGKKLPFRILHKGLEEAIYYVRKDRSSAPSNNPDDYEPIPFHQLTEEEKEEERESLKKAMASMKMAMEKDSLHSPVTAEWPVIVEWHLKKETVHLFIENILPDKGRDRVEEVAKRMSDAADSATQELLGLVTLGHATTRMGLFSVMLQRRLEAVVGERRTGGLGEDKDSARLWGTTIDRAYLKTPNPGKHVNEARADASAAMSQKEAQILRSEGEKQEAQNKADAAAYAKKQDGVGERDRLIEISKAIEDHPDAFRVLALEAGKEVVAKAGTIVVSGGAEPFADLLTLGSKIVTSKPEGGGVAKK